MNAINSPVTVALGDDPLFTPKSVASRHGISVQTLANMRSAGRGPHFVKTPYGVRYRLSALAEWERTTFRDGKSHAAKVAAAA